MQINRMHLQLIMLWLGLALSGFFSARYMRSELSAGVDEVSGLQDYSALADRESREPRFEGEIEGLFLAPRGVAAPKGYVTYESLCGTSETVTVPFEDAGMLDLPVELPQEYVLDGRSVNTGVIACGNTVYAARWNYVARNPRPRKDPYIVIGRSLFTSEELFVARGRPKAVMIGGRAAVLIEPLTPDGYRQNARIFFPEPFGHTFISATGISKSELMLLAEIIASSTR